MTWKITPGWTPADSNAAAYIAAVEAADGQALENGVKVAIDNFVLGCKADGIWNAIKASCILAGARTLSGALVPLVGAAPTNFNFVSGDYNRKTGLVGDGSTKYLDSNRNNNADPQNSKHVSVYLSNKGQSQRNYLGPSAPTSQVGDTNLGYWSGYLYNRLNASFDNKITDLSWINTFYAASRGNASFYSVRVNGISYTVQTLSQTPFNGRIALFSAGGVTYFSDARLAFYSIGESLNLALLDARVTTLINAFSTAIP